MVGLERIPSDGPALLIYYHGAIPIDLYYLMAKIMFYRKRQIRAVGDKFLFKIPGESWKILIFLSLSLSHSDLNVIHLHGRFQNLFRVCVVGVGAGWAKKNL